MKTRIHINKHRIASNRKHGTNEPIITVKTYKSNRYAHQVVIHGPSKLVYSPDKPLSCGAHVWLETNAEVEVIDSLDEVGPVCGGHGCFKSVGVVKK